MDTSLFLKYSLLLSKKQKNAQEVSDFIYKETGITIPIECIEIKNGNLTLFISSAVKTKIISLNVNTKLEEFGFKYLKG